jgi:hypothetical protein
MKLDTHPNLVPDLRISGIITLLPIYTIKAWIGTTLLLPLCYYLGVEKANVLKKTFRLLHLCVAV